MDRWMDGWMDGCMVGGPSIVCRHCVDLVVNCLSLVLSISLVLLSLDMTCRLFVVSFVALLFCLPLLRGGRRNPVFRHGAIRF